MRGLLVMHVMRACDLATLGRHRIETARMPRVATAETFHRQPAAVQHAESLDRLQRVIRAGRVEAARRTEKRADDPLVEANQECDDGAHCSVTFFHSAARLARSSEPGAARACGRALTTRSRAGISCWCRRKDSRTMRRMRLRSTAPPAARTATASPKRGQPRQLEYTVTAKNPLPKRRPRA